MPSIQQLLQPLTSNWTWDQEGKPIALTGFFGSLAITAFSRFFLERLILNKNFPNQDKKVHRIALVVNVLGHTLLYGLLYLTLQINRKELFCLSATSLLYNAFLEKKWDLHKVPGLSGAHAALEAEEEDLRRAIHEAHEVLEEARTEDTNRDLIINPVAHG